MTGAPSAGPHGRRRRPGRHRGTARGGRACRRCRGRPGWRSTSTRWPRTWRDPAPRRPRGVPVHPVVKADAYGHGAVPIARALEAAGADGFCVATLDEALELRDAGIGVPIRVLYPIPASLAAEAAAGGHRGGRRRSSGARTSCWRPSVEADRAAGARPLLVELEVETGLGRGGVPPADVAAMSPRIDADPRPGSSGSGRTSRPATTPRSTARQLERFEAATSAPAAAGSEPRRATSRPAAGCSPAWPASTGSGPACRSTGSCPTSWPTTTCDRRGRSGFRPVMSLHARPVRVADLPAGHGVSYGPTFTTTRPSRIATLPLGYGDGIAASTREPGRGARPRPARPARRQRGDGRGDGRRDRRPGRAGRPSTTSSCSSARRARNGSRAADLARLRTTNTWEVVTQMARADAPGVPCGGRSGRPADAHRWRRG